MRWQGGGVDPAAEYKSPLGPYSWRAVCVNLAKPVKNKRCLQRSGLYWKTAYGALYWLYEGKTLLERRERLSENLGGD